MSLPEEKRARAELAQRFEDIFARAERAHNAAVEILTRGKFTVSKPESFDPGVVVLSASLLTKACKTFRAIQLTAEAGLGHDASVLARQLFETAVAVKFILQKDSRLRAAMFGAHEDQRWLVIVEQAIEVGGFKNTGSPETLERAREKVQKWCKFLPPEVVASVRRHWSGEGLEWAAREVNLLAAYTMMYRYTSAFAHGSDATAHFFVKNGETAPTLKLVPSDDLVQAVLESSIALLTLIVTTINEAFGLDENAVVDRMEAEISPEE